MNQYNESLSIDRLFYAQDIKGSIAYARANVKTGILTQGEFEKLEGGLKKVQKEWEEGKFQPAPGDEGEPVPVDMLYLKSTAERTLIHSHRKRAPLRRDHRNERGREASHRPQSQRPNSD